MSLPFFVLNAFTTGPFQGNPAAVVLVDDLQDEVFLQNIAANVNQPVTAFLRRDTTNETPTGTATFDVRWFTSVAEVPLCGHATIAASGHLFFTDEFMASSIHTIRYRSREGLFIDARKVGKWIELSLISVPLQEVSEDRKRVLQDITSRALRKQVTVKYAGVGPGSFARRVLIEIDAKDDLAGCNPNPMVFVSIQLHIVWSGVVLISGGVSWKQVFLSTS
jgi:PhzF family phenazine biosynthesis protein